MVQAKPDVTRFGALLGEYRHRSGTALMAPLGLLGLGLGALLIFVGFVMYPSQAAVMGVFSIVGGLALTFFSAYGLWSMIVSLGTRVQLYEHGFVATRLGKITATPWTDVSSITQEDVERYSSRTGYTTSSIYRITLVNGHKLRFGESLGGVYEMGETMQRRITQALAPRALEALRDGETQTFGELSVNLDGIAKGSRMLPWSEVSGSSLRRGVITISQNGARVSWATVYDKKTPNMYVLLALVEAMRGSGEAPR